MKRPVFGLSTFCGVFMVWTLFSVPLGFSYPLEGDTDSPELRFVEEFKLGFSWRNMSCVVCKAIFATVDIALLVRFPHCVIACLKLPWLSCCNKCYLFLDGWKWSSHSSILFSKIHVKLPTIIGQNILYIKMPILYISKSSNNHVYTHTHTLI